MTVSPDADHKKPALLLAEALVALICHDLSGPLGTLMTALELAHEEPDTAEEALQLAREAALRMGGRLRLLRASWGGECAPMSRATLQDFAAGLPPRVRVMLDDLQGDEFDGPLTRVLLNAVLLGAEALPRGGAVSVAGTAGDGVTIAPEGPGAAWPAGLSLGLMDPASCTLDHPREVLTPMLGYLAQAAGLRARLLMSPGIAPASCPPLLLERLT